MAKIKSKKYIGVYKSDLISGDVSYYITYKDENSKKIWQKIGLKSEGITEVFCHNKRNEILTKLRLGESVQIGKRKKDKILTIDEIAQKYFDYIEYRNKDYSNVISRYKLHIKDTFGDTDILTLTIKDIQQYQMEKLKIRSPKTVNHLTQLIGTIYNHNIKYENLKVINPLVGFRKLKVDNARERYLSIDDINTLYSKLEEDEVLTLFVILALTTGGRLATLMNIKKKDIKLENKVVVLKDFKNDTTYNGYLNKKAVLILGTLIKTLKLDDLIISKYKADTIQHKMKPILDKLFNQELKANDAKNRVVIHTLRHTFASHLAINGTPIYTIQKLMNHKDIQMTLRYAKLAPDSGLNHVMCLYE